MVGEAEPEVVVLSAGSGGVVAAGGEDGAPAEDHGAVGERVVGEEMPAGFLRCRGGVDDRADGSIGLGLFPGRAEGGEVAAL